MIVHRNLQIGGKDVPAASERTTEDFDPYTGEAFATVAAGGAADVTRAVDAADAAFAGRFGGRWGLEAFSNTRWVTLATRHAPYPF